MQTFFDRTAWIFKRQVEEDGFSITGGVISPATSSRLGRFGGMTFNNTAVNIIATPFQDRWVQGTAGYKLEKECFVDVLRDNYIYADLLGISTSTWLGIKPLGLYAALVSGKSTDKRPVVKLGDVTCQIFGIADDPRDACVKLTARRMQ